MICRMDAGIIWPGCWPSGGTLTDAWHLDDLHLLRPEYERTEISPGEFILEERSGLSYKYV